MESHKFLAYLEYIRSYAWSFGYSNPALSSVERQQKLKKNHPPTQSFCRRNIWMVPGQDGKQGSKEDDNVSNSLWGLGAQSKTTLKSEGVWKGSLQSINGKI